MQEIHIQSGTELKALCDKLKHATWLALDTEFIRERSYYPKLCLLQLSNGTVAATIDPLSTQQELKPLLDLLFREDVLKIFHASRQDLEIFLHYWGKIPQPLFDTQLAAALLGHGDQIGYADLAKTLLNKELCKKQTRTDWSQRPLNPKQLRYALDDVAYLGELYLVLYEQLEKHKRVEWLQEECKQLSDPSLYQIDKTTLWQRVKKHQPLNLQQRTVLQHLTAWRETQAQQSDLPRRWIIPDNDLIALSTAQPKSRQALAATLKLSKETLTQWGEPLLEQITTAVQLTKNSEPKKVLSTPELNKEQVALTNRLMAKIKQIAKREGLSPSLLATRKELEKMVLGQGHIRLTRGWRKQVVGSTIQSIL